jgi:hypothetical protein
MFPGLLSSQKRRLRGSVGKVYARVLQLQHPSSIPSGAPDRCLYAFSFHCDLPWVLVFGLSWSTLHCAMTVHMHCRAALALKLITSSLIYLSQNDCTCTQTDNHHHV